MKAHYPTFRSCVLLLPGRGGTGPQIASYYDDISINCSINTIVVSITPPAGGLYPPPGGPKNQENALKGIPKTIAAIEKVVKEIEAKYDLPKEKVFIGGFSAGAVVAIQTAVHSNKPFAGVISHCGAILDPESLPECQHPEMPFFLLHKQDDRVFSWEERYLPMRKALTDKKYNVTDRYEKSKGGHGIASDDMAEVSAFLQFHS